METVGSRPRGAERSAAILIVGSINMDLVARCPRIPAAGETILGSGFTLSPGGKGANSAAAVARLLSGVPSDWVAIVGAVGQDEHGAACCRDLQGVGVAIDAVRTIPDVPTGVALIEVSDDGENSIVVVPGANGHVHVPDAEAAILALAPSILLVQLEIPFLTVMRAAEGARAAGARVILDPAPTPRVVPPDLFKHVDVLVPNEGELAQLTGMAIAGRDDAHEAAEALRARGIDVVVVKRGAAGALIVDGAGARDVPAWPVQVIDTTGAGDCFDGALAVALYEGKPLDEATLFATHAAALACTRLGARAAQPTRLEVERTL